MTKRQDSGSSSAHQNQRPTAQNEDTFPEMTDDSRNMADDGEDDEFDDSEDDDSEDIDDVDEGDEEDIA